MRAAALLLIEEEPRNGYQLIQEITDRSASVWTPSPGTVYPVLSQLEDEGLIELTPATSGKVYQLTEAGRSYVEQNRAQLGTPWDEVAGRVPSGTWEVVGLTRQVIAAASQVTSAGSQAQAAAAAKVLTEARRALYRILADGDEGTAAPETGSPSSEASSG
jgi:DNA-binding PadR family transcriptional regulator